MLAKEMPMKIKSTEIYSKIKGMQFQSQGSVKSTHQQVTF